MAYRFADLLDLPQMQQLLDSFCGAVGIAAAIIDLDGEVLVGSNWQRICTDFHRVNAETCTRCIESDTRLANELNAENKGHAIYRCRNGLTDTAAPIGLQGEHVANFFVGQFLLEEPDVPSFRAQAAQYGFDEEAYLEALGEVPIVPEEKLKPILDYLVGFAQTLGEMGLRELRRREAAEALAASRERFKELAELLPEMVWEIDTEGRFTFVNRAAFEWFGFGPEDLAKGVSAFDFFVPEDRKRAQENLRLVASGRPAQLNEYTGLRKDGTQFPVLARSAPVYRDGKLVGFRGLFVDITERKRAESERQDLERQIQHAQKLESLGVLAGGIAHDFNNLLMGVLGYADLALMDLAPEAPAREYLEGIETSARRAAELAKQMLAYSGKGRFIVRPLDLSALVQEMTHLLEVSISKKSVLKYHFAEGIPSFEGDATQVRQVVMNLITNASDAIGDRSGLIGVRTGAQYCDRDYLCETYLDDDLVPGLYVYLEVSDTGCGMTREQEEKIFDPFFTTKFTGRGLGLAAVLGIVRGHSGAIKVYSEPGKGTTFKVLFPIADEAAECVDPEAEVRGEWQGAGTVLLVDDEDTVRALGRKMLERMGFSVLAAADGLEGVEVFREHCDDIRFVLLDMTMPHMGGEEAFREMHRIRDDVPVILSSGYNEQDAVSHFAGKGLAGFIQKPYGSVDLKAALRQVLGE